MSDVSEPRRSSPRPTKKPFPWLALLLLAAGVIAFWIVPSQLGERPVRVEFTEEAP